MWLLFLSLPALKDVLDEAFYSTGCFLFALAAQ